MTATFYGVTPCGQPQPGSLKVCDLAPGHDGQHETWLTRGNTRCYWFGEKYPVKYRVITEYERTEYERTAK